MNNLKKILLLFVTSTALVSTCWAVNNSVQVEQKDGIYHIILDGNKVGKKLKFISSESLITNKEAHIKSEAILTVNAGFFDPKNQKTISYIVSDKNIVADPLFNDNLLMNPVLRKNLDKIVNRTEFRVVECDGKYHYDIVPHKTPVDFMCNIETSAQGGPLILPDLNLEEEFFIVKKEGKVVRESASVLEKTARTVIGLKKGVCGDEIHILIFTNENPKNIYEVQDYCKSIGLYRAMAFDGGSSTSLNYKNTIDIVSTKDAGGRMLKSFLILQN